MTTFWVGYVAGALTMSGLFALALLRYSRRWPKVKPTRVQPATATERGAVYRGGAIDVREYLDPSLPQPPIGPPPPPQAPPVQGFVDHRRVRPAPRRRTGRQ